MFGFPVFEESRPRGGDQVPVRLTHDGPFHVYLAWTRRSWNVNLLTVSYMYIISLKMNYFLFFRIYIMLMRKCTKCVIICESGFLSDL